MLTASASQWAITVAIVAMIGLIATQQARALRIRTDLAVLFFASTILLSYVKYVMELNAPVDSVNYYITSLAGVEFNFGTDFVSFFTSVLTTQVGLGFLPAMMLFALLAILALQLAFDTFRRVGGLHLPVAWQLGFLVLVLPSMGFWGSGISKDGFALLGVALLCWALTLPVRIWWGSAAVLLVALVRPHMAVIILAALAGAMMIARGVSGKERLVVVVGSLAAAVLLIPIVIEYADLGDVASLDDLGYRVESYASGYEGTAAFVDITDLPLPLQIFTYLFRPLPWEASSLVQLAASLQNAMLLAWMAVSVPYLFRARKRLRELLPLSYLAFGLLGTVLLAMTTANLGISTRQKWMVVFPLLFVTTYAAAWCRLVLDRSKVESRIAEPADQR